MFRLFRIHHYVKNLFVFAPLIFSFNFENWINVLFVFILFSLVASSIYIFNDLMDIEEDKKHPSKKYRPIASGEIDQKTAIKLIVLLASISLSVSFFISTNLFLILVSYFILNITYSIKLKHIAIIDILVIATGFVLRVFAGNSVLDSQLSMWIIIMTFLLALFLAVAKRRDDVILSNQGKETRKNIDGYNLEFVNATMILMAGVIIVSYILYTISKDITERLNTEYLYLTSFFVILGIIKYMHLTFVEENSGNPTKIILQNKFLQLTILFWLISFFILVKI